MPISPAPSSIARPSPPRRTRRGTAPGIAGPLAALSVLAAGGCADLASEMATDIGLASKGPATVQAKLEKVEPVTSTGRPAAVLSVHMRKSFTDACKYGMTLTNNLPFKITNLSYRFAAILDGNVPFDIQTKNFYELKPGERQYREITFQGVECSRIDRLEVSDPGRCALKDLNRFNAEPGDCAKFSDLADSRLATLAWKRR